MSLTQRSTDDRLDDLVDASQHVPLAQRDLAAIRATLDELLARATETRDAVGHIRFWFVFYAVTFFLFGGFVTLGIWR
jgi:hypothetical protein